MPAPSALSSTASVTTDESALLDSKLLELRSQISASLGHCVFNPDSPQEFVERKRRFGLPPFEAVLLGQSIEPWTPGTLLEFLEKEHNAENLYFWEEVEALRAAKNGGRAPPTEVLHFPPQVRTDDVVWVTSIADTFVKDSGSQAINIASTQRSDLLKNIATVQSTRQVVPEIFNDAQNEVRKLMLQDSWPRFLVRMTTENVDDAEKSKRLFLSFVMLAIIILLVGLMLGLMPGSSNSRYYLFLTLPLWFAFWDGIVVHETGVCSKSAFREQCLIKRNGVATTLRCPVAKGALKAAAIRTLKRIIALTIISTGLTFALSYIVEAGQGKTMY